MIPPWLVTYTYKYKYIWKHISLVVFPYHKMIFYSIRYYFRLAVGCSAYGIHFSAKFVNFDIFTVVAIKEAAVFTIILMIIPFFKRVS